MVLYGRIWMVREYLGINRDAAISKRLRTVLANSQVFKPNAVQIFYKGIGIKSSKLVSLLRPFSYSKE